LPESLTWYARLSIDSERSPIGPTTPPMAPTDKQSTTESAGKNVARAMNIPSSEPAKPPTNPAQVLFGLTSGSSFLRPSILPEKYAKLAFPQVTISTQSPQESRSARLRSSDRPVIANAEYKSPVTAWATEAGPSTNRPRSR